MRSNNFFDQFNDEISDAVRIVEVALISGCALVVLAIGAGCVWLLR
jgi:hypothetical protein